MKQFLSRFLLYFLIALVILQFIGQPPTKTTEELAELPPITLGTSDADYPVYGNVSVLINNNRDYAMRFNYDCLALPFIVQSTVVQPEQVLPLDEHHVDCNQFEGPREFIIMPGSSQVFPMQTWAAALFAKEGRYRIAATYTVADETFTVTSNEITIRDRGFFGKIWYYIFQQPIYNLLIGVIWLLPGGSLGWGIIVLTLIVRLILLAPSQKALRAQKNMQKIQPELERLRKKYKDNQQKLAEETMKLWSKHKVNPLGSCLPILIQFPLLLALFDTTRRGVSEATSHTLYPFLANFNYTELATNFFGVLPLTERNLYVLPILIGAMQFIQLKLSFAKTPMPVAKEKKEGDLPSVNPQKTMMYILPPMIALFAASVPAGVSLYWGTSTLFAIVQQIAINRERTDSDAKVIDAEVVEDK